jgi:S-adenosylmethionine hydrolase
VDRFGNCILNLAIREWEPVLSSSGQWELVEPVSSRVQLVRTYQDIDDGIGLLKGSQTMFELALNQASCARRLNLEIGSRCVLQPVSDT